MARTPHKVSRTRALRAQLVKLKGQRSALVYPLFAAVVVLFAAVLFLFHRSTFDPLAGGGCRCLQNRDLFNKCAGWGAGLLGFASLVTGLVTLGWYESPWREIFGKIVVGAWVVGLPVFFWVDWVYFTRGFSALHAPYPAGMGKAATFRSISANSRRVRWLSAPSAPKSSLVYVG